MSEDRSHMEVLREMLESQLLGVLGTHHDGEPYTSLVGFAATEDLKELLFATGRATRKRANLAADFTEASAATAVGVVEEVPEGERAEFDRIFLAKLPHLESFVHSPSCVRLRLRVSTYMVVTHFQHVIELQIES